MRSIWNGHIKMNIFTVPVKVYTATETAKTVRFNQLHKEDMGRISYQKVCKVCGKEVSSGDIVKGYQVDEDQYVVIDDDELKELALESTKVLEIEGFVEDGDVPVALYEKPYYVGPNGPVAAKTYGLLREAIRESGKVGIGRVVLRGRETIMAVRVHDDGMVFHELRYPSELRSMEAVPELDDVAEPKADEVAVAGQLIELLTKSFDDLSPGLVDRYTEAVVEMVHAKIEGREVIVSETPAAAPVTDVMAALQASIEEAKAQAKPAKRATGAKKTAAKKTAAKKTAAKKTSTKRKKTGS
ncbi:MAG: Ku protein [Rubricoccaceae bacterium]|nr:Ku protein [Rubricoccaceae bacterium]